ncbi:hypothetical protein DID80_02370 [Candidatus Marinamargulisbacteria bacterium SCGC AAA071-K20]|nr:hypothetical protein DID80_02370 [Candidatus Marinamargulisbacteria bacterium SCGC AAA071-K20]
MKLRPVSYLWKKKPQEGIQLGLIAQEVYEVVPEIVNVSNEEGGSWGMNYMGFIPILIKSAQDQQVLIAKQDQSIEALMDMLEKLEKDVNQVQEENNRLR